MDLRDFAEPGPGLNAEGRRASGLDPKFIAPLNVYAQSRGRTPGVFVFNPLAEGHIAYGSAFTPKQAQLLMARDLANLPQFLCRQDDVVLVPERPSIAFLSSIKDAGFPLPEFVELASGETPVDLRQRKIGSLRPWAWGPDSVKLFEPLVENLNDAGGHSAPRFTEAIARLYSKAWSAELLKVLLPKWTAWPWICRAQEVGVAVNKIAEALEVVDAVRGPGHARVVVKQAYGVAGQNSIRLWEPELRDTQRRWLEHTLSDGRVVVVEPWLERLMDFSIQSEMAGGALRVCGYTGLINDLRGQFQANWAAPDFAQRLPPQVTGWLRNQPHFAQGIKLVIEDIRAALESGLLQAGYSGPVGIDCFVYRSAEGEPRLKPIVEINPRYTMGRLTIELMKRTCPGSCGLFRLVSHSMAAAAGFSSLAAYAQAQVASCPIRLEGEAAPKIREGVLCLNDLNRPRAVLALFKVARRMEELLPGMSSAWRPGGATGQ